MNADWAPVGFRSFESVAIKMQHALAAATEVSTSRSGRILIDSNERFTPGRRKFSEFPLREDPLPSEADADAELQ